MIWHDLVVVQIPLLEKVFRTFAVYAGILLLLRLAGKRDLAQITTFDLVVILLLSNVVQNAIIGPDNSVLGGLFGAALLIGANAVVVRLTVRSERAERIFEGTPTVLIRDGEYDDKALSREGLNRGRGRRRGPPAGRGQHGPHRDRRAHPRRHHGGQPQARGSDGHPWRHRGATPPARCPAGSAHRAAGAWNQLSCPPAATTSRCQARTRGWTRRSARAWRRRRRRRGSPPLRGASLERHTT